MMLYTKYESSEPCNPPPPLLFNIIIVIVFLKQNYFQRIGRRSNIRNKYGIGVPIHSDVSNINTQFAQLTVALTNRLLLRE